MAMACENCEKNQCKHFCPIALIEVLLLKFDRVSFSLSMLTRALCPVHIPDRVRTAARIISGLPVSIMLSSRGTPLFWNILSAPASSLDSTIRLLAA